MGNNRNLGYGLTEKGRHLDELGERYFDSISSKYPGDFLMIREIGKERSRRLIDRRSLEQKDLANEIVGNSLGLIETVAFVMLNGSGWRMPNGGVLRLSGGPIYDSEDLINEGVISVLRRMYSYRPSKGRMIPFIGYISADGMYRHARNSEGLLILPQKALARTMKLVYNSSTEEEAIKRIMKDTGKSYEVASLMYLGCKPGRKGVNFLMPNEGRDVIELMSCLEVRRGVEKILSSLDPIREEIVRGSFGIGFEEAISCRKLGRNLGRSKSMIEKLKNLTLNELRSSEYSEELRSYLECF